MLNPANLREWLETEDPGWDRRASDIGRGVLAVGAVLGVLVVAIAAGLVPALPWSPLGQ